VALNQNISNNSNSNSNINNNLCLLYIALPFLRQTRVLLYPMTIMFIIYIVSVALRWNMTLKLCNFYYYRL